MKFCGFCGRPVEDGQKYCANCGKYVGGSSGTAGSSQENRYQQATGDDNSSFIDKLNDYVGNDKPADLNWKVLFTDVFKAHTKEDAEDIFICGTRMTTPHLKDVSRGWPHPWLYSRVFFTFFLASALLWICCAFFGNLNALPGLIVIGSFTVPLSTMILFLEVNAYRDISFYEVMRIFLVGGCASLVATLFLFSIFGVNELDFFGALSVGVIEELGKAIIVYYFIKRIGKPKILSGLLVGASVGAGFAAFESAGYAMNLLFAGGWEMMMDTIFVRGFLAPGGHVTWAAITGAAIAISAKSYQCVSTDIFTDARFLRLFAIPVILHGLWDSPLSALGAEIYLIPLTLTAIVWIVVMILINMGLSEVNHYKNENDEILS